MKRTKTVGIKELKNNLSSYLRQVRAGTTIYVSDRENIVAELQPHHGHANLAGARNPLLMEWVEAGLIALPTRDKQPLPESPVRLPERTAEKLLDTVRRDSGE